MSHFDELALAIIFFMVICSKFSAETFFSFVKSPINNPSSPKTKNKHIFNPICGGVENIRGFLINPNRAGLVDVA